MSAVAKNTETLYKGKMKSKHLRTQAGVLAAFRAVYRGKGDGKRELANWLCISHQAVCNWFIKPARGGDPPGIPHGYQGRLMLWAVHHGFVLHPEAFGLAPDGTPLGRAA